MESRDFVYWLQGFFEVAEPKQLNARQVQLIRAHLNLVFKHEIDPSMGSEEHRQELQKVHDEGKTPKADIKPKERVRPPSPNGGRLDLGPRIMC